MIAPPAARAARSGRKPQSLLKEHHPEAHIGKVFGIVSGKGGVGKSMVTSQLAVTMRRRGYQVGILDADVTGPSIPKAFGIHGQAMGSEAGLYPHDLQHRHPDHVHQPAAAQ